MVVEEEGSDGDEEMILPHGKVDPAVLAALPPSMQLDLLVQMFRLVLTVGEPVKQPSSYFAVGVASICESNILRQVKPRMNLAAGLLMKEVVRMTLDLQSNLDLMKEIEKEKMVSVKTPSRL
ncbi:hypothetical protein OIU77_001892 [Salix suchowensis]|uniref:Uncharacterized protein n=1 Tax=Salix suchowensis TaxID=1278906 RepID=A0ABQ9B555_9ROSI|nr:hypothetical protein OIU77_001892 [Salix suchowensis]